MEGYCCKGLQFVYELHHPELLEVPRFSCTLCNLISRHVNILNHIYGKTHQLNYIKRNHPDIYEEIGKLHKRKSEEEIKLCSKDIIEKFGRKTISYIRLKSSKLWEERPAVKDSTEMSINSLPQPRTRRSKSSTPLVASNGLSESLEITRHAEVELHNTELHATPVLGKRQADASFRNDDKISPMLAKLRMTPGRLLKEKQSLLVRKHETARQRVDSVNVGGGVSLWPEMESMRLNDQEIIHLASLCVGLAALVTAAFTYLHGNSVLLLLEFERNLTVFMKHNKILTDLGQEKFEESVILWHSNYRKILAKVHSSFDISNVPMSYMMYVLAYLITICVLLYYLIDNMFAKSKLSPKRIKRWACLLSVSSTWTLLMVLTLTCAFRTELAIERNVHLLSEVLADAIVLVLKCDRLHSVLLYWRTRCLPPTTSGNIAIFGVLGVRDLIYYLQYYSLPIVTVLITPVFKVFVSLLKVYNVGTVT